MGTGLSGPGAKLEMGLRGFSTVFDGIPKNRRAVLRNEMGRRGPVRTFRKILCFTDNLGFYVLAHGIFLDKMIFKPEIKINKD